MIAILKEMKKRIPDHPELKKTLEYLMNEGMSEEEALNLMIIAWLSDRVE